MFLTFHFKGPINPETGLPTGEKVNETGPWRFTGRDEEKCFLYEIIANKKTGIDVDKWDYFLRDSYFLKINHVFDYDRYILQSRLIKTGARNRWTICIRDKEKSMIEDMFLDRTRLHCRGYQHRVKQIIEYMLVIITRFIFYRLIIFIKLDFLN